MKQKLLYGLLFLVLAGCQKDELEVSRDDFSVVPVESEQVKGELHVKFKVLPEDLKVAVTSDGVATDHVEFTDAINRIGTTRLERVFPYAGKFEPRTRKAGLHLWYKVVFDENVPSADAMKVLRAVSDVAIVEPVLIPESDAASFSYNDPFFEKQWHLYNPGTNGMIAGADISILEAWEIEKGKPEVIVNILDTQIDLQHMDLMGNLWRNPGEYYQDPFMDNDGNGYIGDWYGISGNPYAQGYTPDNHGTHVAGIIAAKNNNGIGVCGVAGGDQSSNGVRIMANPIGRADAIKYGADHGAVICTNSWHVDVNSSTQRVLQDAIDYFVTYAGIDENGNQVGPMKGGIVFASAGNDGREPAAYYPASLDNVIAVAAIGPNFKKSGFSNYADWVDISAPGGADGEGWQIYSCAVNNRYMEAAGTSQATPVVAGVAALIISKFGGVGSGLTPYDVEFRLLRGVKSIDEYNPGYEGKLGVGCVDALLALSDDPVNYRPTLTADKPIEGMQVIPFGQEVTYVYTVDDKEDGADVNYEVEDSSGVISHRKEGNKIILTLVNRNCVPGDYVVKLTVTDKGEIPTSTSTSISLKLQPELLRDVVVYPNPVVDMLNIRASMTFSGRVTVRLYDVGGNMVLEQEVNISLSEAGKLDLSKIDGGSYTLKLSCNNKVITKNIIKL